MSASMVLVGVLAGTLGAFIIAVRRRMFVPARWPALDERVPRIVHVAIWFGVAVAIASIIIAPEVLTWNVVPAPFWSPARTTSLLVGAGVAGITIVIGYVALPGSETGQRSASVTPRGLWPREHTRRDGVILLVSYFLLVGSLTMCSFFATVPPQRTGTVLALDVDGSIVQGAPFPGAPYLVVVGATGTVVVIGAVVAFSLARRRLAVELATSFVQLASAAVAGTLGLTLWLAGEQMWLLGSIALDLSSGDTSSGWIVLVLGMIAFFLGWLTIGAATVRLILAVSFTPRSRSPLDIRS